MRVKYILEIGELMRDLTQDVLNYLDTNEIPEQWITNDLGDRSIKINEDFIDELDVQEQINETEMEASELSFNNKLLA